MAGIILILRFDDLQSIHITVTSQTASFGEQIMVPWVKKSGVKYIEYIDRHITECTLECIEHRV